MFLALEHFSPHLRGYHVLVCTDSTLVYQSSRWSVFVPSVEVGVADSALGPGFFTEMIFITGHVNQKADFLLRHVVGPGEWHLHMQMKNPCRSGSVCLQRIDPLSTVVFPISPSPSGPGYRCLSPVVLLPEV